MVSHGSSVSLPRAVRSLEEAAEGAAAEVRELLGPVRLPAATTQFDERRVQICNVHTQTLRQSLILHVAAIGQQACPTLTGAALLTISNLEDLPIFF
jgi:hypothetical protein